MRRDPKRIDHPKSVYFICLFVLLVMLFVLGGVINQFAFSPHGPGLLIPLVEKFQKKESPEVIALKQRQKAEAHRHFHDTAESSELPEGFRTDCTICHSTLPHTKSKKVRSVLNMHSNYLACETCHVETETMKTVTYAWYSPLEKNPKGPFFGTAYDPESGELKYIYNQTAKIIPFRNTGDVSAPLLYTKQGDEARVYMKVKGSYTIDQRKEVTEVYHTDIRPKGPECQTCHSLNSILDFKKLGFSEKRIFDLENLSIQGLFTRYDTFHIPDLFNYYGDSEPEPANRSEQSTVNSQQSTVDSRQ